MPRTGSAARAGPEAPAAAGPAATRGVSFGEAVSLYWSRYVVFSGRASRAEYWWAMLFLALVTVGLAMVDAAVFGYGPGSPAVVSSLFGLATLLPTLAISVRRLHDIDRSGWWILLLLVPFVGFVVVLVFHLMRGTDGPNRFGGVVGT